MFVCSRWYHRRDFPSAWFGDEAPTFSMSFLSNIHRFAISKIPISQFVGWVFQRLALRLLLHQLHQAACLLSTKISEMHFQILMHFAACSVLESSRVASCAEKCWKNEWESRNKADGERRFLEGLRCWSRGAVESECLLGREISVWCYEVVWLYNILWFCMILLDNYI